MAFDVANLNVLFRIASFCCLPICHINPLTHTMGCWDHTQIKCFFLQKINEVVLDRVWSSSGSSIVAFLGLGLSFSGFKIPKILSLSFSGLRKLAQNLSSFQVYRFERKFWPKFGQNPSFLAKFSIVQK